MLRYALRALRNSPGYTAACIAILALGIGANTAIFSLVYSVVLRPLPYPDADRLVFLWERDPNYEFFRDRLAASRPVFDDWRQQAKSFSRIAAFTSPENLPETGVERPRAVSTMYVGVDLLPLVGAEPKLGRLFRPDEERAGEDRVIILSSEYFEQRFHGDPATLGKTVTLNKVDYTLIGVLPADFRLPANYEGENRHHPDAFVPLSRSLGRLSEQASEFLNVVAALKPGVTIARAKEELTGITTQRHKVDNRILGNGEVNIYPIAVEDQSKALTGKLYLLLGAVGFVLLIACANLANLTFARATVRMREIAVRRALGASRTRIVLQLLSESFVVSLAGAVAGLLVAMWIVEAFQAFAPADVQRPGQTGLSVPVFLFAAAASILTALLFGLMPAMAASRISINAALKSGGRSASAVGARSRQALTIVEVALAMVLLAGAGLLIRSFSNAVRTGIGINVEKLAIVDIDLPETRYADAAARERFLRSVTSGTRAIPGVRSAAIADTMPLHTGRMITFYRAGQPAPPPSEWLTTYHSDVDVNYLEVMGLPLLAGRRLTAADMARNRGKGVGVVLINQAFADTYMAGEDPLRQRIILNDGPREYQIAGVAANFRAEGAEKPAAPQYFRAAADAAHAILILRSAVPPESLIDDVRKLLWSLDKELVTAQMKTMQFYVDESLQIRKFGLILLVTFAGLALLLAMIGVYSVLANLVASRTREIGIRMALGADSSAIGRMVARQSFRPILAGLVLGLAASLALSRVIESELFQVPSRDPLSLTLSVVAILLTAPFAIWMPTRRATRVECTEALRED